MDLNADLGEGFGAWTAGDDDALLALITSANVACGLHAGDPSTMRAVCVQAASRRVAVGAHVGYRDLAGFGRRYIAYRSEELADDILYQLAALGGIARSVGSVVRYVKPHGALYNTAADDPVHAGAVAGAVALYDSRLAVLGMPGSALLYAAHDAGLSTVTEGFADRAYTPAGRLVSRTESGAVLTDPDKVAEQALRMALDGEVVAIDGTRLKLAPQSLCVHGDTPGAAALAERVRSELINAGVPLAPFTEPATGSGERPW